MVCLMLFWNQIVPQAGDPDQATIVANPEPIADWVREQLPESLVQPAFLLETWQWVGIAALVFLAVVVDRLARLVATWLMRRITKAKKGEDQDEAITRFRRPIGLWLGALVFHQFVPLLDLIPTGVGALMLAAEFVMTVTGVWAFLGLVDVICDGLQEKAKRSANKFDDMLVPLLRRTLKIVVLIVGLVFIASKWTDNVWNIVAGLGLGSVAVAFAARDSVENLFGTFTVLLDKPFQIGDWIIMEDVEGAVELVGFRSTKVRTFYNSLLTVPNRHFISGKIDNMGARRYRRFKTTVALTYDTPPESVDAFCEGVRELIRKHPYTRKDYYQVYLNDLGASSLDVLLYVFFRAPDWNVELRERHRLLTDVMRLARDLDVSFAFPTQSLHWVKPEDLEHPDAPKDIRSGLQRGREAASGVLERSLGDFEGDQPGPVEIGDADPDGRMGTKASN
jgi:MscS family membrane protein